MLAILVMATALLGMGLVVFWMEPLGFLSVLERLTPRVTYRVPTHRPIVALSFDDGPHPRFTLQVLEILRQHGATATFFLIGERALRHPDVVARIKAEGHEVGNHYFKNGPTLGHSEAEFVAYLERTEKAIGVGPGSKLFRPPGGVAWPKQLRLAQRHGYKCVLGCAYPHDPMHPPVWYMRWLVGKNLVPGAIVILHDGISDPSRSIEVLPQILAVGHDKGLRFTSIGALMRETARQGEGPDSC
jgi:peptidoglycan/xylan/chitin deacetylase (PgdA/CDA1 family)